MSLAALSPAARSLVLRHVAEENELVDPMYRDHLLDQCAVGFDGTDTARLQIFGKLVEAVRLLEFAKAADEPEDVLDVHERNIEFHLAQLVPQTAVATRPGMGLAS